MPADNPRAFNRPIPLGRHEAANLRRHVRVAASGSPEALAKLLAYIDRLEAASNAWRFALVGVAEDEAVAYWIADNARRKGVSSKLWTSCRRHMRTDTQEVLLNRQQMMSRVGASSAHLTEALAELASIGALERRGKGRDVRWFISARIATHLTGVARDEAQQSAPPLLAPIQGGAQSS